MADGTIIMLFQPRCDAALVKNMTALRIPGDCGTLRCVELIKTNAAKTSQKPCFKKKYMKEECKTAYEH
eukprot:9750594-Ditylum_brightwellii.AAC.1